MAVGRELHKHLVLAQCSQQHPTTAFSWIVQWSRAIHLPSSGWCSDAELDSILSTWGEWKGAIQQ